MSIHWVNIRAASALIACFVLRIPRANWPRNAQVWIDSVVRFTARVGPAHAPHRYLLINQPTLGHAAAAAHTLRQHDLVTAQCRLIIKAVFVHEGGSVFIPVS